MSAHARVIARLAPAQVRREDRERIEAELRRRVYRAVLVLLRDWCQRGAAAESGDRARELEAVLVGELAWLQAEIRRCARAGVQTRLYRATSVPRAAAESEPRGGVAS